MKLCLMIITSLHLIVLSLMTNCYTDLSQERASELFSTENSLSKHILGTSIIQLLVTNEVTHKHQYDVSLMSWNWLIISGSGSICQHKVQPSAALPWLKEPPFMSLFLLCLAFLCSSCLAVYLLPPACFTKLFDLSSAKKNAIKPATLAELTEKCAPFLTAVEFSTPVPPANEIYLDL